MSKLLNNIITKFPQYSWIDKRTLFLTLHGSKAYGTDIEGSDSDFKGFCIPPKEYYFGLLKSFEQVELKTPDPDITIYEIRKFFRLASKANPSLIEVLFTEPSDHQFVSSLGEEVLDHKNDFLSRKIRFTFAKYSLAQLKRIKLHRKYLLNPPKEYPTRKNLGLPEKTLIPQDQLAAVSAEIQKELDKSQFNFMDELSESEKINIRSIMSDMLAELKISTDDQWMSACRTIGLSDNFIQIMQKEREYTSKKREWNNYQDWKTNRNPLRAKMEEEFGYDGKHALHLVRLLRICREILETGKVIVKRPDREELLDIRKGKWSYDKLIEYAEKEEKIITELYNTSTILPESPDYFKLDQLCVSLIEKSFS